MNNKDIQSINTINELEKYRNEINEAIDKRKEFITLCEIADNASKKSFGYIKESFENIAPALFKTSVGKSILNKYTKAIKGNKNLQCLHSLYENIRKTSKDSNLDFFINTISNENWCVNKKTINEDVLSLGKILAEGILLSGLKPEYFIGENRINENKELDLVVKYISENKKTHKNIAEYSDATQIIKEHMKNNKSGNFIQEQKVNDLDEIVIDEIFNYSNKYNKLLSEEESKIVYEINNASNKEELFNSYKNNCLEQLSEARNNFSEKGDTDSLNRLNSVIDKVSKKTFISENIITDLCGFMDLKKLFE